MSKIKKIGVIGCGQMGSGIAQVCAINGYEVVIWDTSAEISSTAIANIELRLGGLVRKGIVTEDDFKTAMQNLHILDNFSEYADCDLIIEAVIENPEVKKKLFNDLSKIVRADCILASNTSSISITTLAAASEQPKNVIGLHFMNPVPVMKLLEIIRGLQTSEECYQRALEFSASIQKTPVLAIDSPGFIVNRVLCPMINEAIYLLQEGVAAKDIDTALKLGTNHPMGPLELADFVGLDTLLFIMKILHKDLGEDKYRPCPLLANYVAAGWLGKKTGRGFYQYNNK